MLVFLVLIENKKLFQSLNFLLTLQYNIVSLLLRLSQILVEIAESFDIFVLVTDHTFELAGIFEHPIELVLQCLVLEHSKITIFYSRLRFSMMLMSMEL